MPQRLLAILIFACIFQFVSGAKYTISADYITMQEGLSDNNVNAILKDQAGFIWFGTSDGLNRYDGFTVKSYHTPNSSLNINFLYQCSEGYLWVGTPNSLHIFNPVTESFLTTVNLSPDNADNLIRLTGIAGDLEQGLLLATNSGLAVLTFSEPVPDGENAQINWLQNNASSSTYANVFTAIANEQNGTYWLGTPTNQLVKYVRETNTFTSFELQRSNPTHSQFTITNLQLIDNRLIISTVGNGIYLFDTKTGDTSVIVHQGSDESIISHKDVYGVVKDSHGSYWVATWDGLDHLQELSATTHSEHYNWDHPLFKDQLENRMISILADPSGVVWVGTHGGGAVKINLEKQFFNRIRFNSLYEVKSFTSDAHQLYTALYHGGIKKTTLPLPSNGVSSFEQFSTKGTGKRYIPTDIVLSSVKDEEGNIWFGTMESSLLLYQPKQDIIREVPVKITNQRAWKGRINALLIDRQGRFWLGTSNGLVLFDRQTNTFRLSQSNPKAQYQLTGNYIRALLEDQQGNIWVGTNRGLNKLIYHEDYTFQFNHFNDLHPSSYLLDNNEVWALHQMPDGRIWIGYRSALGYYDALQSTIHFLNKRDGLCHNFVTCFTHHSDNSLWIGTNSGISRLNTQDLSFTNYYIANNLRAAFKTTDGQLLFGNNKGLLYFYPDSIKKRNFKTPVYITDILIQNRTVDVNEPVNDKVVLSKAAPYTSEIDLFHPINSLAINYVGLSYLNQKSNQYKYRLTGLENDWTTTDGTQRSVTYNNLKPGSYRFEVKAANSDGMWNEETTHLRITIHPAWYASWWGRLLLISLSVLVLITLYLLRMKQIYRAKNLELQSRELEHELTIARIERSKEHELAEVKSRFFTNISHELRTPLTLIMAPAKDLIKDTTLPDAVKHKLATIHQQAQQLYELISQLLDLRKIEVGQMKLQASENYIEKFIVQIVEHFKPYALHKGIKLIISKPDGDTLLWFDVKKLHIVVSNLLSNAIKFSPAKEQVIIRLSCTDNKYYITVTDNGPGIPKNELEKIFERFYQTKNQPVSDHSGSGVGLSLAQEFILLHHGNIKVSSAPGHGAEFTIELPLGDTHLSQNEKGESTIRSTSIEKAPIPDQTPTPITPPDANPIKLLLAEDHQQLREYLSALLSNEYTVLSTNNGKEAFAALKSELPDIVVSDIMMPEMDGIELCEAIKNDDTLCHLPVILLTAKSGDKDIIEGLENGADDYITKPFTPEVLLAKIDNLVKSRRQLKKYYSQKLTLSSSEIEIDPHQEQFIKQAIDIVEHNLTNPQFNASLLAESLNMSQPTLYRRIKTFTGNNIATFIRSIRIRQAALLLKSGNYTVGETAARVGFNDLAYFRKCFSQQLGTTPSKYKNSL